MGPPINMQAPSRYGTTSAMGEGHGKRCRTNDGLSRLSLAPNTVLHTTVSTVIST